jgi:hypothetical protein
MYIIFEDSRKLNITGNHCVETYFWKQLTGCFLVILSNGWWTAQPEYHKLASMNNGVIVGQQATNHKPYHATCHIHIPHPAHPTSHMTNLSYYDTFVDYNTLHLTETTHIDSDATIAWWYHQGILHLHWDGNCRLQGGEAVQTITVGFRSWDYFEQKTLSWPFSKDQNCPRIHLQIPSPRKQQEGSEKLDDHDLPSPSSTSRG